MTKSVSGIITALIWCVVASVAMAAPYRLGVGDVLAVTVFDEPDLSGEFAVSGGGWISLPLIEPQHVDGATVAQVRDLITARLADGFLKHPKVSVAVAGYRPFYILGEVKAPGAYPYAEGLTVIGAVALGGGLTYRADEDDIDVQRQSTMLEDVALTDPVMPGDVIHVRQRFF